MHSKNTVLLKPALLAKFEKGHVYMWLITVGNSPMCLSHHLHSLTAGWSIYLENGDLAIESVDDNEEWLNKQPSAVVLTTF